jgi:hypothetical protein
MVLHRPVEPAAVTGQVNFCNEPFRGLHRSPEKSVICCAVSIFLVACKSYRPKTFLFETRFGALLGKRFLNDPGLPRTEVFGQPGFWARDRLSVFMRLMRLAGKVARTAASVSSSRSSTVVSHAPPTIHSDTDPALEPRAERGREPFAKFQARLLAT